MKQCVDCVVLCFCRSSEFEIVGQYTPDSDVPDGEPREIGRWVVGPPKVRRGCCAGHVALGVSVMQQDWRWPLILHSTWCLERLAKAAYNIAGRGCAVVVTLLLL
jgi:hypothetical protein